MTPRTLIDTLIRHFQTRISVNEIEMKTNRFVRDFTKWWFDLIKNAMLVVALNILAQKANVWYATTLYWISYVLFVAYCMTYIQGRYYLPFGDHKGTVRFWLTIILGGFIAWMLVMSIGFVAGELVNDLSKIQTR